MRLVCLLGIPQSMAGLWRQEHAKKQGFPRHAEKGGGSEQEGVRSLQVSPGGRDEVVRGWYNPVTKSAALNSNKLVTFSGGVTLSTWFNLSAPQFPLL